MNATNERTTAPATLAALRDVLAWMEDCLLHKQARGLPSREAYETIRAVIDNATK